MSKFVINGGLYRHPVVIQKQTTITNDYGEQLTQFVDVAKTRAAIFPISGREYFASESVNSEVSHKINMRYLPNITPNMMISYNGRSFRIISVVNFQERCRELQLMCKEYFNV